MVVVNATQRNVLHYTATRFLGLTTYLPTYLPTQVGREVDTCSYFHAEQPSVCEAPNSFMGGAIHIHRRDHFSFSFFFLFLYLF